MELRLGKQEYVADPRTMMLGNFIEPIVLPHTYDFDRHRAKFPIHPWGNDQWGNCVKVGQANQLIRLERIEQKRTLKLNDSLVVEAYKEEVERQFGTRPIFAGGAGDDGLVVLHNLRNWRKVGWTLDFTKKKKDARTYTISAFGEIIPSDYEQVKGAIYLLHGAQLGFWLPRSVRGNYTRWDYNGESSPEWQAGSWGGHLVYAKAYDGNDIEILTWGMKVKVSRTFVAKYCDEAWAVVDNFDNWRSSSQLDTAGMLNYLRSIGATGIE
jgi:hypothetical protein